MAHTICALRDAEKRYSDQQRSNKERELERFIREQGLDEDDFEDFEGDY